MTRDDPYTSPRKRAPNFQNTGRPSLPDLVARRRKKRSGVNDGLYQRRGEITSIVRGGPGGQL